jgi:hypothetical protein
MSHTITGLAQAEEGILNFEVSDDVLESAARPRNAKAAAYTVPSAIICIPLAPQSAARE